MKFRIYAFLATLVLAVSLCIAGAITAPLAAALVFLTGATLSSYRISAGHAYACLTPFDALRIATESLPDVVHTAASWRSIWIPMIPRKTFPKNTGTAQTTFVIGNSEPTSIATWTEVTQTNNVISTMCQPSYTDVDVGYTERTYNPRRYGLAGPVICRETLSFAHQPEQFIRMYLQKLVNRAKREEELQLRTAYTQIADKYVARTGGTVRSQNVTVFPQLAATSQVTWDILEQIALNLMQEGATNPDENEIEFGPDGPLFICNIGVEQKQRIFTNVTSKRDDVRFAQEGFGDRNLLFRRLGATDTHKNFRLVPELFPPRYSFTPGVGYTEIPAWTSQAASEGTISVINPTWQNAAYEGLHIIGKSVMNWQIVSPETAGLDWNPLNWMFDWIWKTGAWINQTYCYDPLGKLGRHFAEEMAAPESVFPNFGATLIFKRCPNDVTTATCSYP